MPAIFDSLVHNQGLPAHKAWRVAYIVPFIIIVVIAVAMFFTCEDTPTGKWSERHLWAEETSRFEGNIVNINSGISSSHPSSPPSTTNIVADLEKKGNPSPPESIAPMPGQLESLRTDTVVAPTFKEAMNVLLSLSTAAVAIPYACSFGAELAINSILGDFYAENFPYMGQTKTGQWAAMFGLLNVICRPAGGFIADLLYRHTQSVWSKKILLSFLGVGMGAFQLALGFSNPKSEATMFGLTAGLAFFLEACNGANFAVVPHVHPFANGMLPPPPPNKTKTNNKKKKKASSPAL